MIEVIIVIVIVTFFTSSSTTLSSIGFIGGLDDWVTNFFKLFLLFFIFFFISVGVGGQPFFGLL